MPETMRRQRRYLVRDYMDGCWSEHDTAEEAEASRRQLAAQYPAFRLRVTDLGPGLDRFDD